MAGSFAYAHEARKQVGQFLVKQAGYSKKSETHFYKQGDNILTHVYLQRSRGITQVHVGITPLYIPNSLHILFATNLTRELLPGCILVEDDHASKAEAWTERVIKYLDSGFLSFMESISSPQSLLDYLKNLSIRDRRFVIAPLERDMLIFFSSAYQGEVMFAVEYAKKAQQKIKEERIDTLSRRIARWDREIAEIRDALAKANRENTKHFEEMISRVEREKQIATLDAEQNAPSTIQQYGEWIEPFLSSVFSREEYFAQIIEHNRKCLKYEKLFSRTNQRK